MPEWENISKIYLNIPHEDLKIEWGLSDYERI